MMFFPFLLKFLFLFLFLFLDTNLKTNIVKLYQQLTRGKKMVKIRKAKSDNPMRILIYGVEGVGKSTFGAMSDNPIFVSAEDGSGQLTTKKGDSVDEFENIKTFQDLLDSVDYLIKQKHDFKTLVIDSIDWIEKLAHAYLTDGTGKSITTVNGGYGAGYRDSEKLHIDLINRMQILRNEKNMHIVLIAHTKVKSVKDPDVVESYDTHELKCHDYISELWKEWVEVIAFARFNAAVVDNATTGKRILSDGSRLLYLQHQAGMKAKNRYDVPSPIEFTKDSFDLIKSYWLKKQSPSEGVESLTSEIKELMQSIKDKEVLKKVEANLKKFKGNATDLTKVRDRLIIITKEK